MSQIDPEGLERLCEALHNAYEAAAAQVGWETQEASRKPWGEVPEANKETMRQALTALVRAPAPFLALVGRYDLHQEEMRRRDIQQQREEAKGPHSRACGWAPHEHGKTCHSSCPTCHGQEHYPGMPD